MRIVTFNIRYGTADDGPDSWPFRKDRCRAQIETLNPDLLCLQEALKEQLDYLQNAFPQMQQIGVGRDDGATQGEYAAILTNKNKYQVKTSGTFWLSSTPEKPGSADWGDTNVRICTWADLGNLTVFNTHLAVASQQAREKGVALILERIPKGKPTILAGDFNADEDNPACQALRDAGFLDTYRAIHITGQAGTYNGFKEKEDPEKIDYIWISTGLTTTNAEIVKEKFDKRWPSDHFPVIADLADSHNAVTQEP